MAMAAMNMVSAWAFLDVTFHLRRCPQGVAYELSKKIPIFGSRRSKLDHLTVSRIRFTRLHSISNAVSIEHTLNDEAPLIMSRHRRHDRSEASDERERRSSNNPAITGRHNNVDAVLQSAALA
jgi:hypothetical protein